PYRVTVRFEDGDSAVVELLGDRVFTDVAAGPSAEGSIELEFLGQDGKGLAGEACAEGDAADNIHIRVSGLSGEREVAGFQVDDYVGGGRWVYPCNDENWLVVPRLPEPGMADLYLKPHRDAPDDTEYIVTVYYGDGTHHRAVILGSAVTLEAE
ncbi:MAG: hypothetical protein ACK2UL_06395, partial [Anaerolineae bacterium]